MKKTFDIKHANWEKLVQNNEDIEFLKDQLARRKFSIGSVDTKLQLQMKRKNRKEAELKRIEKEKERKQDEEATCSFFTIPSEIESDDSYLSTSSASSTVQRTPVKRKRPINIVTAEVAAALDRTKVTDRMAVHNLVSFSKALGHSPEEIALNRWTIRRSRRGHR